MGDALLRATGITKRYGGIDALRGVDLEIHPGEVHALMGENGAGKSTLAKIVAGVERPDGGVIEWMGRTVAFHDTREATAAGIAIVLQELSLIPDLSVAENLFLVHDDAYHGGWWLDRAALRRRAYALYDRLGWELPVEPDRKVGDLTVAEQQMVEILRALSLDARLFILDEPTATLSPHEVAILFRLVRTLRDQGAAFLLVTHRLEEVFALSDRITVYRDGASSGQFETAKTTESDLIRAMVGRDLGDLFQIRQRGEPGAPMLTVRGLTRGRHVRDANFEVRRGEIVGIAGLVGAGRTELIRAIFGADRADRGAITLNGRVGLLSSPAAAIRQGAALVPEDRKAQGLSIEQSIAENVALANVAANGGFWSRPRAERSLVERMVADLRIKAPQPWRAVASLSGGNQQKVVLAKWLALDPDLMILDEPTRGIDIGAKFEVYRLIDGLANAGKAVLLVSSELPEILALADRILVMRGGAIVAEMTHDAASEEAILSAAVRDRAATAAD
ncbi:MAG: sugar ABC transporter ATP-binding protein [Thermomicrobiales bacterium]|nr:sugar ABC transporter ATP-binding protein [Thermomicrobiales bacterium]